MPRESYDSRTASKLCVFGYFERRSPSVLFKCGSEISIRLELELREI